MSRKKDKYKIAVIPGDGTGPEVVGEGLKVLAAVSQKAGFKYEKVMYDFGGERYKKTKEILPDSALRELKTFDAIYLGAVGHPDVKPGILEKGLLLKLRFSLEQYINLRPVKLYPGVWTPIRRFGRIVPHTSRRRDGERAPLTTARWNSMVPSMHG